MELEDKYESLLLKIHDSKGERLSKTDISKKEKLEERDILKLLEYLIEIELVEFDKQDAAYYLTHEGYEKVAEIKEMNEVGETMANMEFEHLQNQERKNITQNITQIIILGLFLLFGGYFALNGIRSDNSLRNGFDEESLKNVQKIIETKTDSILKARQIEKEQ